MKHVILRVILSSEDAEHPAAYQVCTILYVFCLLMYILDYMIAAGLLTADLVRLCAPVNRPIHYSNKFMRKREGYSWQLEHRIMTMYGGLQ